MNKKIFILKKVAIFFICIIIIFGTSYAVKAVYKYFIQKNGKANYVQDMKEWFDINNEEYWFKKISNYDEYIKYKENWQDIIDMKEEDFNQNFLIVIVSSWRTPGLKITNLITDSNNLYVELDKTLTEEEIKKENFMVSAKVLKDLDRENIVLKTMKKEINSSDYIKLEELPKEYNKEQAEKDGCITVYDDRISDNSRKVLDDFISNIQNNNEAYIRIVRYESSLKDKTEKNIIIMDIQYSNNEYIVYQDLTRTDNVNNTINYLGNYQYIKTRDMFNEYKEIYLENLIGQEITLIIYKN